VFYLSLCLHTLVEFPHRCTNKICTSVFCTSVCCRAMCLLVHASLCCGAYAAASTPSFVSMRLPSQWKTRIAHADRGRGEDGWREGGSSRRSCLLHSQLASAPERACFRAFERAFSSLSPAASTLLHTQQRQRCSAATQLCSKVKGLTL